MAFAIRSARTEDRLDRRKVETPGREISGVSITGQVRSKASGQSVAGALVWIDDEPACNAVTNGDGRFSLLVAEIQGRTLKAAAPGHQDRSLALGAAVASGSLAIDLEPAPGEVAGRILSTWQEPVAGALIVLPGVGRAGRAGPDGSFHIGRLPREAALEARASAEGFRPKDLVVRTTLRGDAAAGTAFVLESIFGASGEFRDAAGEPVSGVEVRLLGHPQPSFSARSGETGRFTVPLPKAGTYFLEVRKEPFPPARLEVVASEESPRADLGVVRLAGQERIWGVVRAEGGEPLKGVEVFDIELGVGRDAKSRQPLGEPLARSAADGSFEAVLEAGARLEVQVEFWKSGFVPVKETIRLQEPELPLLVFLKPSYRLLGTVLGPSGEPVAGATVTVEGGREPFTQGGRSGFIHSDAAGRFEVDGLSSGSLRLTIFTAGLAAETRELRVEALDHDLEVRITLLPEARLSGLVIDLDGRLLPGVGVRALEPVGGLPLGWICTADEAGRFELFGLRPGPVHLELSRPGFEEPSFEQAPGFACGRPENGSRVARSAWLFQELRD
jgi:hypothetical protein